ncbi:MAG: single-stranded DNA-binding protein [Actinobacteria bacterium]|nr:single-stranded DNA-binding protein [Actinomycetota bacterium]
MANINHTYLLGNLTRDPELKYTNEGMAIAEMGIAVNRRWRDFSGEENNAVDYFNITAWNSLAENCAAGLKKGDRVILGGHLNLRSWENKEGKKYNIINITADVVALSLEFASKNSQADLSIKTKKKALPQGQKKQPEDKTEPGQKSTAEDINDSPDFTSNSL